MQLSTIFALSATVISQCAAVRSGILDIQFNGYGDNLTYGSYNVSVPLNGTIVPIDDPLTIWFLEVSYAINYHCNFTGDAGTPTLDVLFPVPTFYVPTPQTFNQAVCKLGTIPEGVLGERGAGVEFRG